MSETGANLSPRTAAEYARFGQNVDEDKAKWASILAEKPAQRLLSSNIDPESLAEIMKLLAEDNKVVKHTSTVPNAQSLAQAAAAASSPNALAAKKAASAAAVKAEEAAARAGAAAARAEALAEARPVIIRRTLSQGDCFYSAVWRALSERRLLGRVSTCLGINCAEEAACILALRNIIAAAARAYIGDTYTTLYNLLASGVPDDRATFAMIVSTTFASWHQEVIRSSMMDPAAFMEKMVAGIRQPRNWASQIEVNTLTHILATCNINLEILIKYRAALAARNGDMDVISLYNPNGVHFEYFSFILPPPLAPSPHVRSPQLSSAAAQPPAAQPPAAQPPVVRTTAARSPPAARVTVARSPPEVPLAAAPPLSLHAAARARAAAVRAAARNSETPGTKRPRGGKRATRKRRHRN